MNLQQLANAAFAAIEKNTGQSFPHGTIESAFNSFNEIVSTHGLPWLIDPTTGTGMSHLGWAQWMKEARERLGVAARLLHDELSSNKYGDLTMNGLERKKKKRKRKRRGNRSRFWLALRPFHSLWRQDKHGEELLLENPKQTPQRCRLVMRPGVRWFQRPIKHRFKLFLGTEKNDNERSE